jgi:pimeloyl-ACP methyl ester carboxylesterase
LRTAGRLSVFVSVVSLLVFAVLDNACGADSRYIRKVDAASQVIVFMHGVLGDGTSTWTNGASYWPNLLTKDPTFDGSSIYVYEYPTNLIKETFSIDEIAENMRLRFEADGVTNHKEIVFLTHSMGGLAARAYLLKYQGVASRVRFIYFFSTPTTGAEVATLATLMSKNPQFGQMRPMQSADYLANLQRSWLDAEFPFPSYCAYEKQKAYGFLIVTQASAASLCNKHLDPIDADHITIVKPAGVNDVSYVAFKAAFVQAPHRTVTNDCFPGRSMFGNGDNAARAEVGVCPDEVDPQRALRIRYVWLDGTSIALLMVGQLGGNLEKLIGANPYVIENAVTKEVRNIIARFGAATSTNKTAFSSGMDGLKDSATSKDLAQGFSSRKGSQLKIFEGGGSVYLPDASFYQAMINTPDFPAGLSMYYTHSDGSDKTDDDIFASTTLWRYVTADDFKNYSANLAKFRDWLMQQRTKLGPKTLDYFTFDDFVRKNAPPGMPPELAAADYFARAGWPEHYLIGSGGEGCGVGGGGLAFQVQVRELHVQVAIIENGLGKGTLPISALSADEIVTDALRPADSDVAWTRTSYEIPVPSLSEGQSIVVPLQMELRYYDGAIPAKEAMADAQAQYQGIQKYSKAVLLKQVDKRTIFKKRKEAFQAPLLPVDEKFTYGPRAKIISARALGRDIALRQFDPAKVWAHFGSEEGSCPWLYVEGSDSSRQSYGRILGGASSAEKMRTESVVHDGGARAIEISENEPEVTLLQGVKIFRVDSPDHEVLVREEFDRLIYPGQPLRIETPELADASGVRIEARGFYRTFPDMVVEIAQTRAEIDRGP